MLCKEKNYGAKLINVSKPLYLLQLDFKRLLLTVMVATRPGNREYPRFKKYNENQGNVRKISIKIK